MPNISGSKECEKPIWNLTNGRLVWAYTAYQMSAKAEIPYTLTITIKPDNLYSNYQGDTISCANSKMYPLLIQIKYTPWYGWRCTTPVGFLSNVK